MASIGWSCDIKRICIFIWYNIYTSYIMIPQTTKPDDMFFHEQTNTFDLTVELTDTKLVITLEDYVDWIIYSRDYTEEDYCKEIHKKMDLSDVYNAFARTKTQENSKLEQNQDTKQTQYEFGTVVESEHIPAYKIDKQGKITAYLMIMDVKVKKQIIYQSKLCLTKVREMTETEISAHKSTKEKDEKFNELKKQIEKQKTEKESLLKRVVELQNENVKLKEELRSTTSKFEEFKVKINQIQSKNNQKFLEQNEKNSRFEQKITQLNYGNEKLDQKLTESNQMLRVTKKQFQEKLAQSNEQLKQLKQRVGKELAQSNYRNQQLEQRFAELLQKFEQQKQANLSKSAEMSPPKKPIQNLENLHSLAQANRELFKLEGLRVQYTAPNNWTQYIFNYPINHNQSRIFKIKVISTKDNAIIIGVTDYAKQKDQRRSYDSGNAMCYHGYAGYKFPGYVKEGGGFRQGDIVEVDVNRTTNTIKYIINGAVKASHTHQMLADNNRVFMAYVEMYDTNDVVEWIPE